MIIPKQKLHGPHNAQQRNPNIITKQKIEFKTKSTKNVVFALLSLQTTIQHNHNTNQT